MILAGSPPRLLLDQPDHRARSRSRRHSQADPSLAGPARAERCVPDRASANSSAWAMPRAKSADLRLSAESDWRAVAEGGTPPGAGDAEEAAARAAAHVLPRAGGVAARISASRRSNLRPSSWPRSQVIALRVRVQNHGKRAYQDIAVHLEADGARLRTTRVSVAPNAETVLTLSHAFDTAGDHTLTVRIEGDSFPEDNACSLVIPVREQVNTPARSAISGKSAPLEGPTDFLEIALDAAPVRRRQDARRMSSTPPAVDYRRVTREVARAASRSSSSRTWRSSADGCCTTSRNS